MKKATLFSVACIVLCLLGCETANKHIITINNSLDEARSFETVEINASELSLKEGESFESFSVKDLKTNTIILSQFVDNDQDGKMDLLLFQPKIEANSSKQYELVVVNKSDKAKIINYCYSRFVPERTDDYAWENNKVAFRTFGPVAQKMVEDSVKGGTLSSGIDAWLKRVEYPIINKWYAEDQKEKGAYHKDKGEGLDNFHVGVSRGVGGIAIKSDSVYHFSKNFTGWKTITTGPIRTSFVLEYEDWDANGKTISETKRISLDYGSNLSRFEIEISGTNSISTGLTLHNKDGEDTQNQSSGWVSYWQPHDNSELGTGIVVSHGNMISSTLYDTVLKDESNLFAEVKVSNNKAIYYAGFGWKKAGDFTSKENWNAYLESFSKKINNPLIVTLN
ncbi:DUF4861 domain-containing protein [Sabulilitoribacter arenilitoris]|uniref:DUF4861 domain-containing protein n=1 Tax=Wocania arenilitoris TaxID=2044858 RepID=A0AAE3ENT8_9FLAO|nr:DUF4861 family protein [Wocania arenilitoris]MCF7568858.1 DUF4861 domain-containing protein [Wocania arenilitoris]